MNGDEQLPHADEVGSFYSRLSATKVSSFVRRKPWMTAVILIFAFLIISLLPLPFGEISNLKSSNPATTAFMKEHEVISLEKGRAFRKSQVWVPLNKIPKSLIDAVVVAEDGTFWSHSGFDWFEFRESMERNFEEGRAARGASTITQQLVKNLYLSSSKNPLRKLREWILTWYMELKLSKSRILEIYLNVIEWGDGIYGVEAASWHYFGKSAIDLTTDEATRLAAIIPSPRRHRANEDSPYVVRRAAIILNRMRVRGMVREGSVRMASDSLTPTDTFRLPVDSLRFPPDSLNFPPDTFDVEQDSSNAQEEI